MTGYLLTLFLALGLGITPLLQAAPSLSNERHQVIAKAQKLIKAGNFADAFDLLAEQEQRYSGDPEFDYLLGVSAVQTQQAGRAAFALERCLAVEPRNGLCRLEMAKAHAALQEVESAKSELKIIESYNPPADIKSLLAKFRQSLENANKAKNWEAWAQIGMGYDTNANSATDISQINIPLFNNTSFTIDAASQAQKDSFLQVNAGISGRYPLNKKWSLIGDSSLTARGYQSVDQFNYGALDIGGGVFYQQQKHQVTAKAIAQHFELDYQSYRNMGGIFLQYANLLANDKQLSTYTQITHSVFVQETLRNSDRQQFGVAWTQALDARYKPVWYANMYVGNEDTNDFPSRSYHLYGARTGVILSFSKAWQASAAMSAENRMFKEMDSTFLIKRKDREMNVYLTGTYNINDALSIRPSYTYSLVDSNIDLNQFNRHLVAIDMRYGW
jgi:hypothetical protein